MSTLKTQYKNWLFKNPNSQLTYVEWFGKFNEIHNLPTDMSNWDVTLNDGLENEPHVSDDFQIGPDGAYEHTEDMKGEEDSFLPLHINDNPTGRDKDDMSFIEDLLPEGVKALHMDSYNHVLDGVLRKRFQGSLYYVNPVTGERRACNELPDSLKEFKGANDPYKCDCIPGGHTSWTIYFSNSLLI